MPPRPIRRIALSATVLLLAASPTALGAFGELPPGGRVDDDIAAGIDPAGHLTQVASNPADVVGGALAPGLARAPWAAFAQESTDPLSQIFVRSFRSGAWTTQGHGTVGGLDDVKLAASSLNFDAFDSAESPSLDFAGTGRSVPWATWSERGVFLNDPVHGPEHAQIFASRFHPPTDVAHPDTWEFSGRDRAVTGPALPSLNIHTDRDARTPAIAGGSTGDPTAPEPWITWVESGAHAPGVGVDQLFVVRPSAPGQTSCDPSTSKLGDDAGPATALGGFCFGQVGIERLGGDPSLNVDRTRAAADPDIAFSGTNDSVPWVVWRETGASASAAGLHDNPLIFAARGVAPAAPAPAGAVDGGRNWVVVGAEAQGLLDDGPNGGSCAQDELHEEGCALNLNLAGEAGPPRVATGTMIAGAPAVPWIVWEEGPAHQILVARLVGSGVDAHFEFANHGRSVGRGVQPDITFSGHTPYISWVNGSDAVSGHFSDPVTFVKDNTTVGATLSGDYRSSLSSTCAADSFTADGSTCPGGALGTPFTLYFDEGVGTLGLRAKAYASGAPTSESISAVTADGATASATGDPQGAPVRAQFEYGPTIAYGSATAPQSLSADGGPQSFSGALVGLTAGTAIHYRAVVRSDLGTVAGADQTFTTAAAPKPVVDPPVVDPPVVDPPVVASPVVDPPIADPPVAVVPPPAVASVAVGLRVFAASSSRIAFFVGVDQASSVVTDTTVSGRLRGHLRTLHLRRTTKRMVAGSWQSVEVRLGATVRHLMRSWHASQATVTARAQPAAGAAVTRRVTVALR